MECNQYVTQFPSPQSHYISYQLALWKDGQVQGPSFIFHVFYILSHNSLCSFIPTSTVLLCTSCFYRPSCSQQFSHVLFCSNFVNLQPLLSCLSSSPTVDRSVDEIRKRHQHSLFSPVDYPNLSIQRRTTWHRKPNFATKEEFGLNETCYPEVGLQVITRTIHELNQHIRHCTLRQLPTTIFHYRKYLHIKHQ